jgi:hypothetical protein
MKKQRNVQPYSAWGPRDRGNAGVRCAAPSGVRRLYPAGTDQEVVAWAGWLVDAGVRD